MQQRQLRLGDILDDYCPRERRLSNHTVVAMVGDDIRLTRCTTCETEHPYKGGKAPRLRKKQTSVQAAYNEVLDSVKQDAPPSGIIVAPPEPDGQGAGAGPLSPRNDDEPAQDAPAHGNNGDAPAGAEEVRLHRPLIRAQLPRIEREPIARPVPEFTMRQASKRQGRFQNNSRPGRFAKSGQDSRGPGGSQGGRQGGRPQGPGAPTRPGGGRHQQHSGPKKRSR
jgi:hypothetical protein